jgi:ERF superfamily
MEKNKEKEKEGTTVPVAIATPLKHANIYAALSAFQGELKPMAKSGTVDFPQKNDPSKRVQFNYTPLGEIMATIYPLLAKHGLSVRHEISDKGVEAILTHETYKATEKRGEDVREGERVVSTFVLNLEGEIRSGLVKVGQASEMKDVGAAITYARRYTLTMVLGISSEDDKDAELLEQSKENAVQTVYDRFKAGVEKAKTVAEVEKSMGVLKKDLETLKAGKAPALGMTEIHYEQLIRIGNERIEQIKSNQDPEGK